MRAILQKAKYFLDIDFADTSDDFLLEELLNQSVDTIETYCNRKFKRAIYTEEVKGYNTLYVKNTPIIDVLELIDEDDEVISCRFTEDKITLFRKGKTSLTGAIRPDEPIIKKYFVSYEGGYDVIPQAISKVIIEMIMIAYEEIKNKTISVKNRNEGSVSQTFLDKVSIQERHKEILDTYKIINI